MTNEASMPAVNPIDVASIDAIIAAAYDVLDRPERSGIGIASGRCSSAARLIPTTSRETLDC